MKTKLLLYLMLLFSIITFAQTTSIPDPNFEQALIDLGYDTGTPNGSVLTANISGITSLNVNSRLISDLTGIQDFVSLNNLQCSNNQLVNLDVRLLVNLSSLNCSNNLLTSLNVDGLNSLAFFNCSGNYLVNLDLNGLTTLHFFDCSSNLLTSLDLTNKPILLFFNCQNNPNSLCIKVSNIAVATANMNWRKDSLASYSLNCNEITTKVQTSQCGINLPSIDTTILADVPSDPVTGYRFRVTKLIAGVPSVNPADIQVFQSTSVAFPNSFRLIQLSQYAYNTSYQVEVSVEYLSVWQPYGVACNVTTPNITTQIRSVDCGITLTCLSDKVYADLVPYAAGYSFNVVNLTNPSNVLLPQYNNLRELNMNLFSSPSAQFGCTFEVTVAIKNYDGTFTAYGSPCTITTPPFPTTQVRTSQCNYTAISKTEWIYANLVSSSCGIVTNYEFKLSNASGYNQTKINGLRRFSLNQFHVLSSLTINTTYNVEVRVEINGVFGPYGSVCTITTPGVLKAPVEISNPKLAEEFIVIAYPNPFENNFKIDLKTNLESSIQLRVYDMLGKLIEDRNVEATEISNYEIGNNYPSGVYNIIISQDENFETLRVIKR